MELLQYLSQTCRCEYLSDLSYKVHHGNFPIWLDSALRTVDASQWPCAEWKEAAFYITHQDVEADSADAYRGRLIALLERWPIYGMFGR